MESIAQLTTDLNCNIKFLEESNNVQTSVILEVVNGYDKFIITISKYNDNREFYNIKHSLTRNKIEDNLSEISKEDIAFISTPIDILLNEVNQTRSCALDFSDSNDIYFIKYVNHLDDTNLLLAKSYLGCKDKVITNLTLEVTRYGWEFEYCNISKEFKSNQINSNDEYNTVVHPATVRAIFILNEVKRRLNI